MVMGLADTSIGIGNIGILAHFSVSAVSDFDKLGLVGKLRKSSFRQYQYRHIGRAQYRRIGKNLVSAHP